MGALLKAGNSLASRRNWTSLAQVVFVVAYVYIPWHFGVFFGQRLEYIYFPRDWLLHSFALLGYIQLAAVAVIFKTQPRNDRGGTILATIILSALAIIGIMAIQYFQRCW